MRTQRPRSAVDHTQTFDSVPREECCVCLHGTRRRTPCGHPLCRHCLQRLRRRECPYCRKDFTFEFGRDELKCFGAEALIQPVISVTVPLTPITRKQLELIRNSASFDALHELVSGLAPKLAISSPGNCQNFRNTVAKQCSEFLSIGWRSMNEANSAARVMIGFMEDGLIEPSCALQTALVDSMLTLRDFTRKPRTPRPASGAFTRRPASASASQVRHVQQAVDGSEALKNWVEKTSLLSSFIEVRLLEGRLVGSNLCLVLLDELRRCLQDLKAHDLLKVIPELQKGAEFLASIAVCHREGAVHMISEALIRQEQIEGKGVVAETRSKLQSLGLATKEATEGKVRWQRPGKDMNRAPKRGTQDLWTPPSSVNILRLGTFGQSAKTADKGL